MEGECAVASHYTTLFSKPHLSASGARYGAENPLVDAFESLLGMDYEPWILLLPATLEQCAVCGFRPVRTFDFWPNGPIPTEATCHACGFEYGGNTFLTGITFEEHRRKWQSSGCHWWYQLGKGRQPDDWNAEKNFADLLLEVQRTPCVPFLERAPDLLKYYRQCIDYTLPTLDSGHERSLLIQARDLLCNAPITGGGSNQTAYRFSAHEIAREFFLLQPERGDIVPRLPIQLNVSAVGEPVTITNIKEKRYTEITPEQLTIFLNTSDA